MKIPFKDENKTEHNINESVSVAWEYAAIGEMIHQALGESRIIHERETSTGKKETNPDVEKIKKTANDFLDKAFEEYAKERRLRFSIFFLSKLFFSSYLVLTITGILLLMVSSSKISLNEIQTLLIILSLISLIIICLIYQTKRIIYRDNNICNKG